MVKFFRRSAKQLRHPLACLGAFTAGCLFASVTSAAPIGTQQAGTSKLALPLLVSGPGEHIAEAAHDPRLPSAQPNVYRLQNMDVKTFESNVLATWGNRLKASTSPNGRYVRVEMPTEVEARMVMLIDRETQTITYEGHDSLRNNWQAIVQGLDSIPQRLRNGTVLQKTLVDRNRAELSTVRQAAFLMGMLQDDQDDQIPGLLPGQVREQLPPGTLNPQGVQVPTAQTPKVLGIQNPVRIIEDPVTKIITIIGTPEDVLLVKKMILDISKAAQENQPLVNRILLDNLQSESVVDAIQELYDASYAGINGDAQIRAISSPNMLIVVGQPQAIESVNKIVAEMEFEMGTAETPGFKEIRLKYMSAADAKDRLDTFFSQANPTAGANQQQSTPVVTIPDFRSNTIVVKGSTYAINLAEKFLATIDVDSISAVKQVKIIPLKNAVAQDIAIVIQDAINGQQANSGQGYNPDGQANQQQQNNNQQAQPTQSQLGSSSLSMEVVDSNGQKLTSVEGGIMFDVRISADFNSNSLVVTASEASMKLVEELVRQLDRIPEAETLMKVIPIINGDAVALLDTLETLFGADGNQGQQQQAGGNLSNLPLQSTGSSDGSTLVNLRFTADPRSNTIIASGPASDLQTVEDLLDRLDVEEVNARTTDVYRLSNAPALDVADALNGLLDPRNDIITNDPRTLGGISQSNRTVLVIAEVTSNSLIISALPEYRAEIERIIFALDRRPPMVKVKVMIAQIDMNELEELGIEFGVQDSLLFDRGTTLGAGGNIISGIGFPFNGPAVGNENAVSPGNLAGQALSNFGTGRVNADLGYGGLVLSAGSESLNILLRALQNKQCIQILSTPQIMTLENLQGRVLIGESVPRVAGTTDNGFNVTQNIEFVAVGVLLEITPRVSPDGMITMQINVKKSRLGPEEDGVTIGFSEDGQPLRAAKIIETEANTTLMARSGQTVVFSGLIQETKIGIDRGVPYLSDLPWVGPLFSYTSDLQQRKELLIIMTPYLVTNDEQLMTLNHDDMERMHWCLTDVAEVYGRTDYDGGPSETGRFETFYPDADPTGSRPVSPPALDVDGLAPQPTNAGAFVPQQPRRRPTNQMQPASFQRRNGN